MEKILSVTTDGKIKSYPQKYIKITKTKIKNKIHYYKPSKELLDKVNKTKLVKDYKKRLRKMYYESQIIQWKEFEYYFDKWLELLENTSSEEGNTIKVIWNRKIKLNKIYK